MSGSPKKLTQEQAREIRLSPLGGTVVGRLYGVDRRIVDNLRTGHSYGPLRMDERAAHAARARTPDPIVEAHFQTFHALKVGRVFPVQGHPDLAAWFDRVDMLDAAHECPHGGLPSDRVVSCECWVA